MPLTFFYKEKISQMITFQDTVVITVYEHHERQSQWQFFCGYVFEVKKKQVAAENEEENAKKKDEEEEGV